MLGLRYKVFFSPFGWKALEKTAYCPCYHYHNNLISLTISHISYFVCMYFNINIYVISHTHFSHSLCSNQSREGVKFYHPFISFFFPSNQLKDSTLFILVHFFLLLFFCTLSLNPNNSVTCKYFLFGLSHSWLVTSPNSFVFVNSLQFFEEYNSKLLESSNYITRRQAVKVWCEFFILTVGILN